MPYRLFLELGMCYTFCIKRVHNRIKKQQMENKSDFEYIKRLGENMMLQQERMVTGGLAGISVGTA